eukprot:COSAG05_NODE_1170_length_5624_cov_2.536360_3_plen_782_part_00
MPECVEYCVVVHAADTKADPGLALNIADTYLNTPWDEYAGVDMFVGGLTSDVSIAINQLLQHNEVPQISYGSTSATLSDTSAETGFPTFFRTVPSDGRLVQGVIEFIEYCDWKLISLLCMESEFGQSVSTDMYQGLTKNEVEVVNNLLFTPENIQEQLAVIKESESRVIFLHCSTPQMQLVLEWAYRLGMLEEGYAWIGTEWAQDSLFDEFVQHQDVAPWPPLEGVTEAATVAELQEAITGFVAMRASTSEDSLATVAAVDAYVLSGEYTEQQKNLCENVEHSTHVTAFAHFAFDAVLLGVEAISRSMTKSGINGCVAANTVNTISGASCDATCGLTGDESCIYHAPHHQWDFEATTNELRQMQEHETGVQGAATANFAHPLRLDAHGDRLLPYDLVNFRKDKTWATVGMYEEITGPSDWQLDVFGSQNSPNYEQSLIIKWLGGSSSIPSDREEQHVSLAAMYLFFFLAFIILSICVGNFLHAHEFYVLPESGATILFGLLLGGVLLLYSKLMGHREQLLEMTEFDTEIFSLFLLPVIIFAAGFNLRKSDFFNNLVPICLCAFIGTGISTMFVGTGVYYLGKNGYFEFGSLGGAESLCFGALISAVDPVATLAVFGALGVETDLNMRVFGESVINDGVSIVLFKVFERYITEEVQGMQSALEGIALFLRILFGSISIGMFAALALAFVMKYARLHSHILESAMVLIGSYTAYAGAEAIHCSGIIASLFCGIAMNHWTYHNFTYRHCPLPLPPTCMKYILDVPCIYMGRTSNFGDCAAQVRR